MYAVDKGKGIGGVLLAKLLEKCFLDHKVKKYMCGLLMITQRVLKLIKVQALP